MPGYVNVITLRQLLCEIFCCVGRAKKRIVSDFIRPFLTPYMGVIPNPKMAFIFPISCILVLIFPFFYIYFPKTEGKSSFPKFQIKSRVVTISLSPQGGAYTRALKSEKSLSPPIPVGWGAVDTNDWYISFGLRSQK